jgi:hypothetical protein
MSFPELLVQNSQVCCIIMVRTDRAAMPAALVAEGNLPGRDLPLLDRSNFASATVPPIIRLPVQEKQS